MIYWTHFLVQLIRNINSQLCHNKNFFFEQQVANISTTWHYVSPYVPPSTVSLSFMVQTPFKSCYLISWFEPSHSILVHLPGPTNWTALQCTDRWHHSASTWVAQTHPSSGQMVLTDCPLQDCVFLLQKHPMLHGSRLGSAGGIESTELTRAFVLTAALLVLFWPSLRCWTFRVPPTHTLVKIVCSEWQV